MLIFDVARPRKSKEGNMDNKVAKLGAKKRKFIKIYLFPVREVGGDSKFLKK
jgi:hypothetical protein